MLAELAGRDVPSLPHPPSCSRHLLQLEKEGGCSTVLEILACSLAGTPPPRPYSPFPPLHRPRSLRQGGRVGFSVVVDSEGQREAVGEWGSFHCFVRIELPPASPFFHFEKLPLSSYTSGVWSDSFCFVEATCVLSLCTGERLSCVVCSVGSRAEEKDKKHWPDGGD